MTKEFQYYKKEYWFDNKEHDDWYQGNNNYYVNDYYESIVMKLKDIPLNGKIVVLGTHNCVSFDKLCKHFGYDRCIGFDLYNPKNHPNIIIKNCMDLNDNDNLDIAFCHNDLGNYKTTPLLKTHGQKWAAKNIIKGGYMLSNNDLNRAKIKNTEIMKSNNFTIHNLLDLENNFDLSKLEYTRKEGYMLCKKN